MQEVTSGLKFPEGPIITLQQANISFHGTDERETL